MLYLIDMDYTCVIFDFDLLKSIEAIDPFTPIILTVEKKINGSWQQIERGRFVIADCAIDNDLCLMEVTPQIYDPYTCINDMKDKDYNILLEVGLAQPFMILNPAGLEFVTCQKRHIVSFSSMTDHRPATGKNYWNLQGECPYDIPADIQHVDGPYNDSHSAYNYTTGGPTPAGLIISSGCLGWDNTSETIHNIYTYNYANLAYIIGMWRIYSVEVLYDFTPINAYTTWATVNMTWCLETAITLNNPAPPYNNIPPTGSGWLPLYQLYVGGKLACKWGREPFYNVLIGPPATTPKYQLTQFTFDKRYFYELLNPYTLEPAGHLDIYRGRLLNETIQMFLNKADCGLTLKSEFFQSDINPVTGERNPVYILNDGSDIKTPSPTASPATINYLTFEKLLNNICDIFDLHWFISGNDFIIEHRKYFENGFSYTQNGISPADLRNLISNATGQREIIRTNKYSYDVSNIYKQEKWNNVTYVDFDFSPLFIDYDLQVAKDSNVLTRTIDFVLDAAGIYNNPSSFSNDSIVIIAIRNEVIDPLNGTTAWVCINEPGYRTNEEVINGWMCLSNLFNRFWRYGRMKQTGIVNALTENFESETGKIVQSIEIKDCDLEYFKNTIHFITDLGTGRKISAEHKIFNNSTKLEILI